MKKKFREQNIMTLALFFVVVADFFLVYSCTLRNIKINMNFWGIACFMLSYICLIIAYHKSFKLGKQEIIAIIFLIAIFILIFKSILPYIRGVMFIEGALFCFELCCLVWMSICTTFRKCYNHKSAILIAVSGVLITISDILVAYGMFYPVYSNFLIFLGRNIIWAAYIIGWTFITIIMSEEDLFH